MRRLISTFSADDRGATAIEYGLIAALIAVALIVSFTNVSNAISNQFGRASTAISGS